MEQTEANMYEAIRLHLEGLREDGVTIPEPQAIAECIVLAETA